MRRKLIAGNWKMNQTKSDGLALAKAVFEVASKEKWNFDVLIFPGMFRKYWFQLPLPLFGQFRENRNHNTPYHPLHWPEFSGFLFFL